MELSRHTKGSWRIPSVTVEPPERTTCRVFFFLPFFSFFFLSLGVLSILKGNDNGGAV
jgi:hypothetical protein